MKNLKIKIRPNYIISLLIIIMVLLINYSVSKYRYLVIEKGKAEIAEPIIVFEKDENLDVEYNKKTGEIEYAFKIKNYNDEKINEVDFSYNLEIIENNSDFPIEYKLIDVSTNEEIELVDNKSKEFKIGTINKEEDNYKIKVNWKDKSLEKYSDSLTIDLKANVVQVYN